MKMNTLEDFQKIAAKLVAVGAEVTLKEDANVNPEELKATYLIAAHKVGQYEREVKALKLSKIDGKHFSLILDTFSFTFRALIAASKGNMTQSKIFMLQANKKLADYELRRAKRTSRGG